MKLFSKKYRSDESLKAYLLRSLLFVVAVIAVCIFAVLMGVKAVNRQLGITDRSGSSVEEEAALQMTDSLWIPDITTMPEIEEVVIERPEASWPMTPCSLYVTGGSSAVYDSLHEAETSEGIPYETQLLVKRWALESGMTEISLDRIYVFNRLDSLYVDLPSALDLDGLKKTIESRFICYTRLFPLVGGNLISSFKDGIPLSGVPGVFRLP